MSLDFNKIKLILKKEFMQLKQQRGLVLSTILLPLLFTVIPIVGIFVIGRVPPDDLNGIDQLLDIAKFNPTLANLSIQEILQAMLGQPLSGMMLIVPVILPSVIASYSIVGEKVSGTLEPLLATPVTTLELLVAKILTSLIPSVGITWFFGAVFLAILPFIAISHAVFVSIISPSWFILFLMCAPLLSVTTIAATVAASSRANDPRSAQQISAIVIIPVVLVIAGQFTGLLVLNPIFSLILALVLAVLAYIATWIALRLFGREAILTRWS